METKKNYGIACFTSLGDVVFREGHGLGTLNLNAALAMYLTATPDERDRWMALVGKARRMEEGSILERLRRLTGTEKTSVKAAEPKLLSEKIFDALGPKDVSARPSKPRGKRRIGRGKGSTPGEVAA